MNIRSFWRVEGGASLAATAGKGGAKATGKQIIKQAAKTAVIEGVTGAAINAGAQKLVNDDVDWTEVAISGVSDAISGGVGSALPNTKVGKKLMEAGEKTKAKIGKFVSSVWDSIKKQIDNVKSQVDNMVKQIDNAFSPKLAIVGGIEVDINSFDNALKNIDVAQAKTPTQINYMKVMQDVDNNFASKYSSNLTSKFEEIKIGKALNNINARVDTAVSKAGTDDMAILKSIRRHSEKLVQGKVTSTDPVINRKVRAIQRAINNNEYGKAGAKFHSLNFKLVRDAQSRGFLQNLNINKKYWHLQELNLLEDQIITLLMEIYLIWNHGEIAHSHMTKHHSFKIFIINPVICQSHYIIPFGKDSLLRRDYMIIKKLIENKGDVRNIIKSTFARE